MRYLFWFLPAVVIPLIGLQLSSGQPSSIATVDIHPTPQLPLPSRAQVIQVTLALPIVISSQSPTPTKKQAKKVIAQKHPPKNRAKSSLSKEKTRPYIAPAIEIRVAVSQNISSIAIASSTKANIVQVNGRSLGPLPPGQSFQAVASNSTILFQSWQTPSPVWIEPTDNGAVFIGDRWYRGKLLLIAQGDNLLAINYVGLEKYLQSVVGSEMSAAAPIEALKAQAVAARSYALVHTFRPASQWYDLSNDERHQAYQGLATEYNTTHQAVGETAGEILAYQGRVVESLYGATQAIVNKAHKGAGMSQTGAYAYANQGYNYQQILGAYYPGVAIALLESK